MRHSLRTTVVPKCELAKEEIPSPVEDGNARSVAHSCLRGRTQRQPLTYMVDGAKDGHIWSMLVHRQSAPQWGPADKLETP